MENFNEPNSTDSTDSKYSSNTELDKMLDLLESAQNKYTVVTKQHRIEARNLLTNLGIPNMCLDVEAECVCVYLASKGLVSYVYTEDTDAIVFGVCTDNSIGINIIKKVSSDSFVEYNTKKILESFNLTKEQFVDLCILCGCDYCSSPGTTPGTTPLKMNSKTCYSLIKEKKSLENIGINFDYLTARNIFINFFNDVEKEFDKEFDKESLFIINDYNKLELLKMIDHKNVNKYLVHHRNYLNFISEK